jgi:hypothetical protein
MTPSRHRGSRQHDARDRPGGLGAGCDHQVYFTTAADLAGLGGALEALTDRSGASESEVYRIEDGPNELTQSAVIEP